MQRILITPDDFTLIAESLVKFIRVSNLIISGYLVSGTFNNANALSTAVLKYEFGDIAGVLKKLIIQVLILQQFILICKA